MAHLAARSVSTVRQATTARSMLAVLVTLALLVLAPPGAAQVADPGVSVTLAQDALELGAANTTDVTATVTNTNANVGGTVAVAVEAPEGWSVVANPTLIPLAAGASQEVTLTLTAPEAALGAATGSVTLTATITEGAATQRTAQDTATLAVTRVDPLPPPPPLPAWYETTAGMVGIGLAVLALAGGVAAFVVARRRRERLAAEAAAAARAAYLDRETGIKVELAEAPHSFGPRRDVLFRVAVENVSQRPRVAVLRIDRPDGWFGASSLPRMPLSPGERLVQSVVVTPGPDVAPDARATITVAAKPEEAQELEEKVVLEIVAPAVRLTPTGDVSKQAIGLRGTANQRPPPARRGA